jgi:hypothetical protein
MHTAMVKRRLAALTGSASFCPACAGQKPILLRGEQAAPTCPVCRKPLPVVLLIHDSNFFGNAERLRQLGAQQKEC